MGRRISVASFRFSGTSLSRNGSIVIGVCCFVFTMIFYSATHLTSFGSFMTECSPGLDSSGQYQQYLLWTLQAPSEKDLPQAPNFSHQAALVDEHESTKPAKGRLPVSKIPSKAAQLAHDATIKLQYAVNSSTIAKIEGPNLLSMAKHTGTFARLLEAILTDTSIDRTPFLDLRERYFGWWKPSVSTHVPWEAKNHTTGIVLTVGQGNMVLAAHAIRTLRRVVKSELPIQVAFAGEEDLPGPKRRMIRALDPNLELINILDHYDEEVAALSHGGYAMKPFAALASSFEKVIIIDADTVFMQCPDGLFEENEGLKRTGTLFFHDRAYGGRRTTDWVKDVLKEIAQEPSTTLNTSMYWQEELENQQESGVVYLNKAIPGAFMSLLFTTYMNSQHVRAQIYGQTAGKRLSLAQTDCGTMNANISAVGDKETFWLASELAGLPYAFHPTYAGIIGPISLNNEGVPEICSPQPLQTDLDGRPFWFNSGIMEDKMNADNKAYANLTHYIPGASHEQPIGGWRFVHDHTFCMGRNTDQMKSVKDAGLESVAKALVAEARVVDNMFKSQAKPLK